MYLVETVDDVQQLAVKNPNQLFYVTQTTLSIDHTAIVIDALREKPTFAVPKRTIFAMQPKIGKMLFVNSLSNVTCC